MSVSGISSSSFFSYSTQNVQSKTQQFQQEFQRLGKDLQSGNVSAAQADLQALQQSSPQTTSTSGSTSPIAQEFNQLSKDLQSGNAAAAQKDYTTLKQDLQSRAVHGHHHHRATSGSALNGAGQTLDQLGQDLQAGNVSAAQQAYAALQQYFQPLQNGQVSTQPISSGVSVSA